MTQDLRPRDVVAGRYRIEHTLGEGAMGHVFAALDLSVARPVALKCMRASLREEPALLARFRREAGATARLRSEHVARVLDHGEAEGARGPISYLAMELLEGSDLRSQLHWLGKLAPRRAAEYVSQACVGLAEAHALGIVHRDIKPANLFITTRADGTPLVKLLDFGIAKFESPNASGDRLEMTEHASSMGSLLYMAPEQILDARNVDGRADVWSLGVVLYQALSGKRPFTGDALTDIAYEVLTAEPRPLAGAAVPPELDAVVMRCLDKKRERRFPNTVELARALAPFAQRHASAPRAELAVRTAEISPADMALLRRDAEEPEEADPPTRRVPA